MNAKLRTGKKCQKTELTGRSQLMNRRSALVAITLVANTLVATTLVAITLVAITLPRKLLRVYCIAI
jgi:hypothetical protein